MLAVLLVLSAAAGMEEGSSVAFAAQCGVEFCGAESWLQPLPRLFAAAWQGNLTLAKQELAAGQDINAVESRGRTALHLAAYKGSVRVDTWDRERGMLAQTSRSRPTTAMVQLLLEAGAAPDVADLDGSTPLLEVCHQL